MNYDYHVIPTPREYLECLYHNFQLAKENKDYEKCEGQLKSAKEFNKAMKSSVKYHKERTRR